MKTRKSNILGEQVMVEGLMAFGKLENGQRTLDFQCCEDVVAEAFQGDFHVQGMRDGNVYMTERPKRHKKQPIFRDDNCSLSHGRNGKYYFVFTMDEDLIDRLPQQLVQQAGNIARKVLKEIIFDKEVMG
ncbi:hypothetical protein [Xylanibacter ruminicola]|uniref:Uncharacterized protein n=1 Tax=Xylanibacter ruminicola TaxID=839 RepID=A0A1M6VEU2_XYLRU|nr:hypothetical protein [Xylanibacter ruminicola]SHK79874.1 hypothetical protein SAMN05216463_11280 [Xylanibacter ruminicola]